MKASEQRLLIILIAMVAVFATGFMTMRMLDWQRALDKKARSVQLRRAETEALLAEAGLWSARLAWLRESQPPMTNINRASSELSKALDDSAKTHNVTIENGQFVEPVETAHFHQVGKTLLVKTEIKPLFQWLHEMLSPETFHMVSHLTIVPLPEDPKKVTATIHVSRLYSLAKPAGDGTEGSTP
ncbi:MAG: hypothetical protein HS117_25925 [Verrucomicrobiaceae bacterium]|jgi:hypothetical protein|nr:hypothetical protein [Verrucomicrobiaceae bacterium]